MTRQKLSAEEYQRRNEAAWAVVARKYCDMFEFWRDCRYKPCRAARRCVGDQGTCLKSRCSSIPYEAGIAANERMVALTLPDADTFTWQAHLFAPTSGCLHKSTRQNARAKPVRSQ